MHRLLLLLALLLPARAAAQAEPAPASDPPLALPDSRWTPVFTVGGARYDVDLQGIVAHGGLRYAWMRMQPAEPSTEDPPYDRLLHRYAFDCAGRRLRTVRAVYAFEDRVTGGSEVTSVWRGAAGNLAVVLDRVCSAELPSS